MCVGEQQQPPPPNPLYRGGLGVLVGYRCGPYNTLNLRMHGMSNVGINNINDLADLLHYAPFPITDSEHHDTK